jgi:hypothetical protein
MILAYFDEVKYQPPSQEYQWLGGLLVDASLVAELDEAVNTLANAHFGSSLLTKATEFHAVDIFHGKANFKGWTIERRLDLLKSLFRIIDRKGEVLKVYARLEPARMVALDNLPLRAFIYFVERVDFLVTRAKTVGLLIGDYDEDKTATAVARDLSYYRRSGTPYPYGGEIKSLVDTVHFTHSHLSRMLQLADLYVWCLQLCHSKGDDKYPRRTMESFIRSETNLLWADKSKEWPTEDSWIQVAVR